MSQNSWNSKISKFDDIGWLIWSIILNRPFINHFPAIFAVFRKSLKNSEKWNSSVYLFFNEVIMVPVSGKTTQLHFIWS